MPHTILIVDDELPLARLAARMLTAKGYLSISLSSPYAALELLAYAGPIDLLIVDVRMPELGGFEFARAARAHKPSLPVLFVSGFVEPGYAGQGGFDDFLAKPFTAEELVAAVGRLLS